MLAFFLTHWFQYFYAPHGAPWYTGNVYGNLFVVPLALVLGYAWSKTKFWPLRPLKKGFEGLHAKLDDFHGKLDAHIAKQRDHNRWMAEHMALQHEAITGQKASPHPHFDGIGGPDLDDDPPA